MVLSLSTECVIMIFFISEILIFPSSEIKPILSLIHVHIQNSEKVRGITESLY